MDLGVFMPGGLAGWEAATLIGASLFTSFLTAAVGIGGGVALLAVMTVFLPPAVLIPVHGVVQIGSNFGRLLVMLRHVERSLLLPFLLGSLAGAGAGGVIAVNLPPAVLQIGLGLFILFTCWGPAPPALGSKTLVLGGAFSSFLTMFFGATGPFVSALLRVFSLGRMEHVGTFSACMSIQHGLKIVAFGVLGFSFGRYLPLMLAMIASGFVGTLLGRRLLLHIDDRVFARALNIVLSLLALRLLWSGISPLL